MLRFCSELGYDLAMISLVDREAGVIRAVRATGSMTGIVDLTVRPLDGDDILAIAVRENRAIVDPRLAGSIRGATRPPSPCRASAGMWSCRWSATRSSARSRWPRAQPLDPDRLDLRPLETLASHTARALAGLRQLEEIRRLNQSLEQHAQELSRSEMALREKTRILQSVLDCMGDGVVVADAQGRFLVFNPAAERILGQGQIDGPPGEWSRQYDIFLPDRVTIYPREDLPLMRAIRGESADQAELYIAYPSRDDGTWIMVTGRPLRDEHGATEGGVVVFHDITRRKKAERRLAAQYETTPRPGRGRFARPGRREDPRDDLPEPGLGPRRLLEGGPARATAAMRRDLAPRSRSTCRVSEARDAAGPALERGDRLPGRVWADALPELDPGHRARTPGRSRRRRMPPGRRDLQRRLRRPDPAPAAIAWASWSSSATRSGRWTAPRST